MREIMETHFWRTQMREKNNGWLLLCFCGGKQTQAVFALCPHHRSRAPWPPAGWVKSKLCSPLDVEGVVQREAEVRPG